MNIKAAGGPGTIRRNHLVNGRYGIVLSDNPSAVTVEHNLVEGRAQHLVFLTSGTTAARARLWANTIVQSGRSTSSGDASTVFVNAATSLELRDNLLCYANADALGVALWVNDATRARAASHRTRTGSAAPDALNRPFAWNGRRTTLAGWQTANGADARGVASSPPTFGCRPARQRRHEPRARPRRARLGLDRELRGHAAAGHRPARRRRLRGAGLRLTPPPPPAPSPAPPSPPASKRRRRRRRDGACR